MASRLQLQSKLEELLGSKNVYYQPPESVKMTYPAIRYTKTNKHILRANNALYQNSSSRYEITIISQTPDSPVIDKLLELPYCSYNRHYASNGLNHDVLILYF